MKFISPTIKQRFFDLNGDPLAGGKLYSYASGSTTPRATFKDKLGTPNTNPIVLNANGECDLWLSSGEYKFTLKDENDVEQWTVDDVTGSNGASEFQSISNVLTGGWYAPAGSGAIEAEEFGFKVFKMPNPQETENIIIKRRVKVPESYAGGDVEIRLGAYTPTYSTDPFGAAVHSFRLKATASLVRKPVEGVSTVAYEVNDLALSVSIEEQVNGIAATFVPPATIINGKPNVYRVATFILPSSIDGQAIVPGDFIDLNLDRTAIDPEVDNWTEDVNEIRIIEDFMEVIFS